MLSLGISNLNKQLILSLSEKFNNFTIEFIEIDPSKHFSVGAAPVYYLKFLIPQFAKNKAIFIDADTIVMDDIAKLYNIDLETYALGAVNTYTNRLPKLDIEGDIDYFNAGVLLLDCEKWRQQGIADKLFEIEKKYRPHLWFPEEYCLNKYFLNNYKKLDKKFNLCLDENLRSGWLNDETMTAYKECVVRHFQGPRPYQIDETDEPSLKYGFNEFWFFAKMTPYFEGLFLRFGRKKVKNAKFLGLPVKIKRRNNKTKFYLFGIKLLTLQF